MLVAAGNDTLVNALQDSNAESPMLVAAGNSMLVNLLQDSNAELPMLVAAGNDTLVNLLQEWNAELLMLVAAGNDTLVNLLQERNAELSITSISLSSNSVIVRSTIFLNISSSPKMSIVFILHSCISLNLVCETGPVCCRLV